MFGGMNIVTEDARVRLRVGTAEIAAQGRARSCVGIEAPL